MVKKTTSQAELLKSLRAFEKTKKLPPEVRELLETCLDVEKTVPLPVFTYKENNWIIATTPVLDVCAQGKTEDEAIKNLEAMIDDFMADPDVKKPEIKTIIGMEIGIKSVPMKLPFVKPKGVDDDPRKNTPVAAQ